MSQRYGDVVEQANLDAAVLGGQPDFTYRPVEVDKCPGRREISDGFVWVGDHLTLTSAKARDPERWSTDTDDRRRSWLDKNIEKAADQISGSWRHLLDASGLVVANERGHEVPWSPDLVEHDQVAGVVIIDCPAPDGYETPRLGVRVPTTVMTRQDWRLVNRAILTATGVCRYARMRAELDWPVPLGSERDALATVILAEHSGRDPSDAT